MARDPLSFLDRSSDSADAPEADAPEPEIVEAPEPSEPEPEAEPEAPAGVPETGDPTPKAAPPAAPSEPQPTQVPINSLLDEREKRQAAQREAEQARAQLAEIQRRIAQAQAQAQQPAPTFEQNPAFHLARIQQDAEQKRWSDKLDVSEVMALQTHGPEAVNAAKQAFMAAAQQNPALGEELRRYQHPYDAVVKWHKRQTLAQAMGDDPDAYIAAQVEARLAERMAAQAPAAPVPSRPTVPPPSLAAAPAVGRGDPAPKGSAFDALFPR